MKRIAIIQARTGSTRLPGKMLHEVVPGLGVLECMVNRVRRCNSLDDIALAIPDGIADEPLAQYASSFGCRVIRGVEGDVLGHYRIAADALDLTDDDIVVRLTGDCPLIDHRVIERVIAFHHSERADFTSNSLEPYTWPDGSDVEVFSAGLLRKGDREERNPLNRRHVTFCFWKHPKRYRIAYMRHDPDWSAYRITLDYEEDERLIRAVFASLYSRNPDFSLDDVIGYLDANRQIRVLNAHRKRNAGWVADANRD